MLQYLMGGLGVAGGIFGAMSEADAIKKRNEQLAKAKQGVIDANNKFQGSIRGEKVGSFSTFINEYRNATNDTAAGLRDAWSNQYNNLSNMAYKSQLDSTDLTAKIDLSKEPEKSGWDILGQSLMGGGQGFMQGLKSEELSKIWR